MSPCLLMVDARVRYWEDAEVNGVSDEDGALIPCREGNSWKPSIELSTGKILGWPVGTTADIHYKVCDDGDYWLADSDGNKLYKWSGDYVPERLLCVGDHGFGDYIILNVMENGRIAGWIPPVIDFEKWEQAAEEAHSRAIATIAHWEGRALNAEKECRKAKELAEKMFRERAQALMELHNQLVEYDKLFDEAEIIRNERNDTKSALCSLAKQFESNIQKANTMAEKAQALIDRWDKPSWKDTAPTVGFIYALRTAVEDYEKTLK